MKKHIQLGLALLLLVVSWPPLFDMLRETWMDGRITDRYEIEHTFERDGFKTTVDTQELTINGLQITIEEIPTGQKAPLTFWDEEEGVPPGDIVRIQYYLNGKAISEADPIWLSNGTGAAAIIPGWMSFRFMIKRRMKSTFISSRG